MIGGRWLRMRQITFPELAHVYMQWMADQIAYTFTFSVAVKGTQDYQISLYFVDWDNKGRKIAVEMFDANTLNLIAPVKIVRSCFGGAYVTYSYNKSVKFRINMVQGDNAVLSGIFFDSDKGIMSREHTLGQGN